MMERLRGSTWSDQAMWMKNRVPAPGRVVVRRVKAFGLWTYRCGSCQQTRLFLFWSEAIRAGHRHALRCAAFAADWETADWVGLPHRGRVHP